MPSVDEQYFATVYDYLVNNGDLWTNENDVLAEANSAYCNNNGGSNDLSNYLTLIATDNDIPTNAIVTSLTLTVRAGFSDVSSGTVYVKADFEQGTGLKTWDITTPTGQTFTQEGDLDYWGLTEQEAVDFINASNGNARVQVWTDHVSGSISSTRIYWITWAAEYKTPSGILLME